MVSRSSINQRKNKILQIIIYILLAFLVTLVIPFIFNYFKAPDVIKISAIIFGLDMIFAVGEGLLAGYMDHKWEELLTFPLMFFCTAQIFFDGIFRYFAIIFLAASLLAYGAMKK